MTAPIFDPAASASRLRELAGPAGAVLLFAALYVLVLAALIGAGSMETMAGAQWGALLAASFATIVAGRFIDGRLPDAGLRVPPRRAFFSLAAGVILAAVAVGAGHLLILFTSELSLQRGEGIPVREILLIILPAALHEELLFRGWAFQKLARWSAPVATTGGGVLFGALHATNPGIAPLALVNIVLAGIMLSLAFLAFRNLWAPIALHYAWNVFSGPVLGYEVSGWRSSTTIYTQSDPGPAFLTGGDFGIEGSIWMLVVQAPIAIVLAWKAAGRWRSDPLIPSGTRVSKGR